MFLQNIDNPNKWWNNKKQLIQKLNGLATELFASEWRENSGWDEISIFNEEISQMDLVNVEKDWEKSFYCSVVYLIDDVLLTGVISGLEELKRSTRQLPPPPVGALVNPPSEDFVNILKDLDLNADGIVDFYWSKIGDLDAAAVDALSEKIQSFSLVYEDLKKRLLLLGLLVLHFHPEKRYTLEEFVGELERSDVKSWSGALRFLGQSFYGNDGSVKTWALNFLLASQFDRTIDPEFFQLLFFIIVLHLGLRDFTYYDNDTKQRLINKYIWSGFCFAGPWEQEIKKILAEQPFVDYYMYNCGMFARAVEDNNELIYNGGGKNIVLKDFIRQYLIYSGGDTLDGLKQVTYIKKQIFDNQWSVDMKDRLQEMLGFYLHLKNGDIIDYKGILSEEGVKPRPFEWDKILSDNLNEGKATMVKDYLMVFNRPFTAQMEIVISLMALPWRSEPYLSRALRLSEIYEEVYGPVYGPLLYYSEKDGGWKLNNDGPPKNL